MALNIQVAVVIMKITAPKAAVFDFQFDGWQYQPPDGDQTCLGYGILPPPPIVICRKEVGSER